MTTFHTSLSTPSYLTTFICNVIPHAWCPLLDWTCAHLVFKSLVSGPQKDQQLDQTDDQLWFWLPGFLKIKKVVQLCTLYEAPYTLV